MRGLRSTPSKTAAGSVAVAAVAVIWATTVPSQPVELTGGLQSTVSIADASSVGSSTARVGLIEFSDFQCRYCRDFALNVLPGLKARYIDSGQMLFVLMHLPNPAVHPSSLPAAEAVECAGLGGSFWQMHDALFRSTLLSEENVNRLSESIGLMARRDFADCLRGQMRARIADQTALAYDLHLAGTPAFLLGYVKNEHEIEIVRRVDGAKADLEDAIRSLIGNGRF
jgi:protein-disulfide isomerase